MDYRCCARVSLTATSRPQSAELKLGNFDGARREALLALQKRPKYDSWCNALDTIILTTTNMRAGEVREGIQNTQRALCLVRHSRRSYPVPGRTTAQPHSSTIPPEDPRKGGTLADRNLLE